MVSRDLTRVLNDQYPNEPETQAYLDQLHALSSLTDSRSAQVGHTRPLAQIQGLDHLEGITGAQVPAATDRLLKLEDQSKRRHGA
jgi:hypothetical protein